MIQIVINVEKRKNAKFRRGSISVLFISTLTYEDRILISKKYRFKNSLGPSKMLNLGIMVPNFHGSFSIILEVELPMKGY